MARRLKPESGDRQERTRAYRTLTSETLFSDADYDALARAGQTQRTAEFDRTTRLAAVLYVGECDWRERARLQKWSPSLVSDHMRALALSAGKVATLLRQLPTAGRLAIEHAMREIEQGELASGRLTRTADRTPRVTMITSSARVHDYALDVTGFLLNPTEPFLFEALQRAAKIAAAGPLAVMKVDPLAAVTEFLAKHLAIPLTVTVSAGSASVGGGQPTGRLVELVVVLTRLCSNLQLPALGLPGPIDIGADAVKKAIYERIRERGD